MQGISARDVALFGIILLVIIAAAAFGGTIAFLILSLKKKKRVFVTLCPVCFVAFVSMIALSILLINNLPQDDDKHRPVPANIYTKIEDINLLNY